VDGICAGIVSYNPDIERLRLNVSAICSQVSKVYIVDNGSSNLSEVNHLAGVFSNVNTIINKENLGIATALNQLCEAADKDQYHWILTLDQDTVCPENLIEQFSRYIDREDAGIICPAVRYEGWDTVENQASSTDCEEVKACMTSGSLTRIDAWKRVKGFREEYFIDFVDNEFCMKLRLAQYKIIRVNACTMSHQLGESGTFNFLGVKKIQYTRHAPWRFYYMIRNNRAFIGEYKDHLPVFKEFMKLWYILLKGVLFSKEKRKTIYYIRAGYRDGRAHNLGKLIQ
jgi:rhamnosyltransferase